MTDQQPTPACQCGHPQERHTLLSGTYAHCRFKYAEAGRGKCFCGMYRPEPTAPKRATLNLDDASNDPHDPSYQISISAMTGPVSGYGYRLMGPSYIGQSRRLRMVELDQRDADEIRSILDDVFPREVSAPVAEPTPATDPFSYEERERTGRNGGLTAPTTAPPAPHSGLLRTAAARTPDPATAALLRTLADAADHRTDATIGLMGTILHPAVALARTILDTATPAPPVDTDLRDRIRRAICEAEGFMWDTDMLEPDEYGEHADAVLAVLPASTDQAATVDQPADRRDRYAAAIRAAGVYDWGYLADAAMAVADAEQAELRAEVENSRRYIKRLDTEYDGLRAEWGALRAEVDRLRANRAAMLREAADAARAEGQRLGTEMSGDAAYGARAAAKVISRMADEAQQPETETTHRPGPDDVQVWPLARVLTEVRCGSQDWSWDEEWADLDQRHAASGYLDRLEQEIKTNGITLPVLIGSDGRLWDGHHRLRIAVRLGIGYVPVEVTPREPAPAPAEHVHRLGNPDDDGILDDWDNCRDPECPGPATPAPSEEPTP